MSCRIRNKIQLPSEIGTIEKYVQDIIVASTTCNTSITTSTYLNVPTASGTYSIDIYGNCVTAYGEYDIN